MTFSQIIQQLSYNDIKIIITVIIINNKLGLIITLQPLGLNVIVKTDIEIIMLLVKTINRFISIHEDI